MRVSTGEGPGEARLETHSHFILARIGYRRYSRAIVFIFAK